MKESPTIKDIPEILKSLSDRQIYIENFTLEQIFYQLKDITDVIINEAEIFIKETETLSSDSFLDFIKSTNQLDHNEGKGCNITINQSNTLNEAIESNEQESNEQESNEQEFKEETNEESENAMKKNKNKIKNLLNKKTAKEVLNFLDEEVDCSISTDNSISSTYLNDY